MTVVDTRYAFSSLGCGYAVGPVAKIDALARMAMATKLVDHATCLRLRMGGIRGNFIGLLA